MLTVAGVAGMELALVPVAYPAPGIPMPRRMLRPTTILLFAALAVLPRVLAAHSAPEGAAPPPQETVRAVEESFAEVRDEAQLPAVLAEAELGTAHEREYARLLAARFLVEHGTAKSRGLLESLRTDPPRLTIEVPGCREPLAVARYPYHLLAAEALRTIERRGERDRLQTALEAGELDGFLPLLGAEPGSPEIAAARGLLREVDPGQAREVAGALAAEWHRRTRPVGPGGELLLAETWAAGRMAPEAAVVAEFSGEVIPRVLDRVRELPASERGPWLEALEPHPAARSAARLLRAAEEDTADPLGLLVRYGAEGAVRLGREDGRAWPALLVGQALAAGPAEETLRHAAMALMLAGTDEAREALGELARSGVLPGPAQEEVDRWLAPRQPS